MVKRDDIKDYICRPRMTSLSFIFYIGRLRGMDKALEVDGVLGVEGKRGRLVKGMAQASFLFSFTVSRTWESFS